MFSKFTKYWTRAVEQKNYRLLSLQQTTAYKLKAAKIRRGPYFHTRVGRTIPSGFSNERHFIWRNRIVQFYPDKWFGPFWEFGKVEFQWLFCKIICEKILVLNKKTTVITQAGALRSVAELLMVMLPTPVKHECSTSVKARGGHRVSSNDLSILWTCYNLTMALLWLFQNSYGHLSRGISCFVS